MEDILIIKKKIILIFSIIILSGFLGKELNAQTTEHNAQKLENEEKSNDKLVIDSDENPTLFTVDGKKYKVLYDDRAAVMFLAYDKLDDSKNIVINDEVEYNGKRYFVKYIYEKAFSKSIKTERKIIIDKNILGFCDSKGNIVNNLYRAFSDHNNLVNLDFGEINISYGEDCFRYCKALVNIEMPQNMNVIEGYCFEGCYALENVDLSNISKYNGGRNFAFCSRLRSIGEINDEVNELPDRTFMECTKLKIDNMNNISKLGDECFKNCKNINKDIITNIKEIGEECFYGCNFNEIYLKEAEKIANNAFGNCDGLTKIRFGNSTIPKLSGVIAKNSPISEYVYPISYKNQENYTDFLRKLTFSKVSWNSNYENGMKMVTQGVKANSLVPPFIKREGYELEGWYKEPKCINKVNMIADLGEVKDSNLVIKDPILYAKWSVIENDATEANPKDNGNQEGQNDGADNQSNPEYDDAGSDNESEINEPDAGGINSDTPNSSEGNNDTENQADQNEVADNESNPDNNDAGGMNSDTPNSSEGNNGTENQAGENEEADNQSNPHDDDDIGSNTENEGANNQSNPDNQNDDSKNETDEPNEGGINTDILNPPKNNNDEKTKTNESKTTTYHSVNDNKLIDVRLFGIYEPMSAKKSITISFDKKNGEIFIEENNHINYKDIKLQEAIENEILNIYSGLRYNREILDWENNKRVLSYYNKKTTKTKWLKVNNDWYFINIMEI